MRNVVELTRRGIDNLALEKPDMNVLTRSLLSQLTKIEEEVMVFAPRISEGRLRIPTVQALPDPELVEEWTERIKEIMI